MSECPTPVAQRPAWLQIHPADNVIVAIDAIPAGVEVNGVTTRQPIPAGHKIALRPIETGEHVFKYGFSIGAATRPISSGDHVHSHNLHSALDTNLEYEWRGPAPAGAAAAKPKVRQFQGFRRSDGRVATRNEIWIITTVGCVNMTAARIAERARMEFAGRGIDGVYSFPHPFGCSQMGDDLASTQALLGALIRHPNAAGVLVIGLGCEHNQIRMQLRQAGLENGERVRFYNAQQVEDEIEHGMALIGELVESASNAQREPIDANELVLGMKCGGSDGFSGITANPLVGRISDRHCAGGGTSLLSEVPEMFGAEQLLMDRAVNRDVFERVVHLINDFKDYFRRHGQTIYENPSPGNKDGGLTTLEDKSLGCVQKGGRAPVAEVLAYGQSATPRLGGLGLVNAPGNDAVSCTAMTAAGAHLILFTTGRGTPFGVPAPTVKISTNSDLANRKPSWIDFDAGPLAAAGADPEALADALFERLLAFASGEPTRNEINGYREIAVWKSGVTL
ncbi:UxaA family hydrolase [Candidatus Laterigemmans baculatus]|uniref:UxaA family hydrolase n=1 Tax=Candidatus Laterigemmans baculatus TaxID=2770505 RepID=UPI0013DA2769|nr:altronate dehydratase family protein [Candidatus Laterigemmans baculatus]